MKNIRKVISFLVSTVFLVIVGGACGGGGAAAGTFTVGGTVTGLVGTLVMQCNGADDLTVTADGAFAFATALADKTAYTVTVLTQPATQTCTVNNGTGTLGGADVTDVAVTCSVNAYTVGGTVTGLVGTLVLQNNGGDDLTLTDNGAFTFVTKVAEGSGYAVTVSSRPIVQNCAVTNDTGTMSGANVTDVAVDCSNKVWKSPVKLSPSATDANTPIHVAMNGETGNAIVVWSQSNGADDQIFMSEHRDGSWINPADVTDHISVSGEHSEGPRAAVDETGNAIVVWDQNDGVAFYQIFMSEYRGGTWTHPATLGDYISPDTPAPQDALNPDVAMDDNGNAIVVWNQSDGLNSQIFKSEYRNGIWTHPADTDDNISTDGFDASEPRVAMDNNGSAVIVWLQWDGANNQIFRSEYRGGSWTHPADQNDNISPDGANADYYDVAMGDNGDAAIVWIQNDGVNDQVFMSEYRSGGWTNPADLTDNDVSPDGESAGYPAVAMDDQGDTMIVWEQPNGTPANWIYKAEYRNGSWTFPTLSNPISPAGSSTSYPDVAMDSSGQAIIVWEQENTSAVTSVFKSEYRSGSWTHPADRDDHVSSGVESAYEPQVAMDPNGDAVIAWQQISVTDQIFMSEFR